jgi:hypothetical protein
VPILQTLTKGAEAEAEAEGEAEGVIKDEAKAEAEEEAEAQRAIERLEAKKIEAYMTVRTTSIELKKTIQKTKLDQTSVLSAEKKATTRQTI